MRQRPTQDPKPGVEVSAGDAVSLGVVKDSDGPQGEEPSSAEADPAGAFLVRARQQLDVQGADVAVYLPDDGSTGRTVGATLLVTAQLDRDDPDAERLCGQVSALIAADETQPWDEVHVMSGTEGGAAAKCDVLDL